MLRIFDHMKRSTKFVSIFLVVIAAVYFSGPKPDKFDADFQFIAAKKVGIESLENEIRTAEQSKNVKPGNQSQFYWADSIGKKTEYVVLYLHGFSASPEEGAPVHTHFAQRYGCNMYVPLLAEHGLVSENPMLNFTAEAYLQSAFDALQVARQMGDKVIIMATSTGCTAGLFLASKGYAINGLICYSPNIRVFDPKAHLLAKPWGLDISRKVLGSEYYTWQAPESAQPFWDTKYRIEALVQLQRMLEGTMRKTTFEKVSVPTFVGYYYKNSVEQDSVVSVPKILEMYEQLGSKAKRIHAFPNAGKHAISSQYFSKDIAGVETVTYRFAENVLGLAPKRSSQK